MHFRLDIELFFHYFQRIDRYMIITNAYKKAYYVYLGYTYKATLIKEMFVYGFTKLTDTTMSGTDVASLLSVLTQSGGLKTKIGHRYCLTTHRMTLLTIHQLKYKYI